MLLTAIPLEVALSGKREEDIVAFEEALAQKLYAIDGEVYFKNAGDLGSSDDGVLYVRLYVVAKGRDFYEAVRSHPEKVPKRRCEDLLGAHKYAWASLTGRPVSAWPYFPSVSYESASNGKLWKH